MTEKVEPVDFKHLPVELIDIELLKPYEKNAKIHTEEQIDKLCGLIQKFGFTSVIVVAPDYTIINGHGRWMACKKLGIKKVQCIVAHGLTDAQIKAMRLSDNKIAEGKYDSELMNEEMRWLHEFADEDFKLEDLGFNEKDLAFAIEDVGELDELQISDDLASEMEAISGETVSTIAKTDEQDTPVAKIFGFKGAAGSDRRTLRRMMDLMEAQTNETGLKAMVQYAKQFMGV